MIQHNVPKHGSYLHCVQWPCSGGHEWGCMTGTSLHFFEANRPLSYLLFDLNIIFNLNMYLLPVDNPCPPWMFLSWHCCCDKQDALGNSDGQSSDSKDTLYREVRDHLTTQKLMATHKEQTAEKSSIKNAVDNLECRGRPRQDRRLPSTDDSNQHNVAAPKLTRSAWLLDRTRHWRARWELGQELNDRFKGCINYLDRAW